MFVYDETIVEQFSTIRAGVARVTGISNGASSPELAEKYRADQRAASARLESGGLVEIPSIAAWRRVFSSFGAKPTRYRNAAEALLRRLSKHGDIPAVNTLADIGNLVSIRHAMPVAVFDTGSISSPITVRFATGDELFTDLGSDGKVSPEPNEVIFVDAENVVCARRWCWRQSAGSVTGPATTGGLIVVEGHHDTARQDVESALTDLASLLASHQPESQISSYLLSPDKLRAG